MHKSNIAFSRDTDFSDERMGIDWTLSPEDNCFLRKFRKDFRTFVAIQICIVKLYGRFLEDTNNLSPSIINYVNAQLKFPPSLTVKSPDRKATYSKQRRKILLHLSFNKFTSETRQQLTEWLKKQAVQGIMPEKLIPKATEFLLSKQIIIPGASTLKKIVVTVCAAVHQNVFREIAGELNPKTKC